MGNKLFKRSNNGAEQFKPGDWVVLFPRADGIVVETNANGSIHGVAFPGLGMVGLSTRLLNERGQTRGPHALSDRILRSGTKVALQRVEGIVVARCESGLLQISVADIGTVYVDYRLLEKRA